MITRYLYRNPQLVWLIIAATMLAGVSSFFVLPRLEDPILKQRVGVVSATCVGKDAIEIESTVAMSIEEWLKPFAEIKQVRSNSRANVAHVIVELADEVIDPDDVWAGIERKLRDKAGQLPDGCSVPELSVFPLKAFAAILAIVPTDDVAALKTEANDAPPVSGVETDDRQSAAPTNSSSSLQTEYRLARELRNRLLNLQATESVELFGNPNEELVVRLKPATLAATGLTTATIAQQISANKTLVGGNFSRSGQQLAVEVFQSDDVVDNIENLMIELPGRQPSVRLSEIAEVKIVTKSPALERAIVAGQHAVVLGVMVDDQSRVDLWTQDLKREIQRLMVDFPGSYRVEPLFLQSDEIEQRMGNLLQNLLVTSVAVVCVVFLFMGWRCMLVVAVSLPLSACLVLCGLRFMSIPIHQMSVTGLIVSLGLLIDNAIVMVEEVRSRVRVGKSALVSIRESTRHLGLPLLGSTMTTVLAFLPIAIMPGPAGEFVGSLAVSVILAISASLLFALTIVPTLVFLLGVNAQRRGWFEDGIRIEGLKWLYRQTLEFVFRWPVIGVLVGALLPTIGFYLAEQLPKQFFPATDRAQIQIEVELPAAANLDRVQSSVEKISQLVGADPAVLRQHWFLGRSAPTFYYNVVPRRRSTPHYAQAIVDLDGLFKVDDLVDRLQTLVDEKVFDARVVVRKLEQGPPFDAPIEIRLIGDDLQTLEELGDQVRLILASNSNVRHTRSDLGDKALKLELHTQKGLEQRNGVSKSQLSRLLYSSLQGSDAGSFRYQGLAIPARVVVDYSNRSITNSLLAMQLVVDAGATFNSADPSPVKKASAEASPRALVPVKASLGSLGDLQLGSTVGAIVRINGRRANEVKAYIRPDVLPSEVLEDLKFQLKDSKFQLPHGYEIEMGGEDEKRSEAVTTLIANVSLIVAVMVITLIAVLGTFRSSLIIAAVAGLAIGLGTFALSCFGYPLGFMAIVGTMGLIGVAINDSIVVLAAIRNRYRAIGADRNERAAQLAEVVIGNTRHILATTFTTMFGFLPLVFFGGEFWPPLAIVISAGVGGATLLALYFTPSLFLLFHRDV